MFFWLALTHLFGSFSSRVPRQKIWQGFLDDSQMHFLLKTIFLHLVLSDFGLPTRAHKMELLVSHYKETESAWAAG